MLQRILKLGQIANHFQWLTLVAQLVFDVFSVHLLCIT